MRSLIIIVLACGVFCSACNSSDPVATGPVIKSSPTESNQLGEKIVGRYIFTDKEGGETTGQLIADQDGHISLVPDRGPSVYVNGWFKVDVGFLNPHGYIEIGGEDIPVYYRGDIVEYTVVVDYNRQLPLNVFPLLYTQLSAVHVVVETGEELFEGAWTEDLSIAPMGGWSETIDWSISDLPCSGEIIQLQLELDMMFQESQLQLYLEGWNWFFGG